ncbi:MAG: AAA family ATPase, partial [Candidatus Asgardarchaeia archaeon]
MKFYDRESELNVLETLNKRRPSFIVITGRRRVGKTELIKQFIKGKNALYFFVDAYKSLSELIDEYAEYIVRELSLPSYIKISKAEEFLEFIFTNEIVKNRQLIIVFDEFQRFLKINPSFIMLLQKFWDLYKNDTNIYLIISGSSIGMIRRIFLEEKAPLFKRA